MERSILRKEKVNLEVTDPKALSSPKLFPQFLERGNYTTKPSFGIAPKLQGIGSDCATQYCVTKPPFSGGFVTENHMESITRSLSTQESKVVLALTERGRREATRAEILDLLGGSTKAADHVIESLRRKGWLERATWGEYLLIPPEQGPEALGDSNLLALSSRIADPYYIGFSTAAAHYGLTTQHRKVIFVVTPVRLREREVGESRVRIVNQADSKFFGFEPVDVLGYKVMISAAKRPPSTASTARRSPAGWAKPPPFSRPPAAGSTGTRQPIISNG